MNSKFIINLFGIGVRYWNCEIPIQIYEEMNKIRLNHKVEWECILFDFDFLKHFGLNHWSELSSNSEQIGFLLDPQNRIEIKMGAKFIARFRAIDLNNTGTLFPLFKTKLSNSQRNKKPFIELFELIHFEKGLIAKYQFDAENFKIEDLEFHLAHIGDFLILKNIENNNGIIKKTKDDSLTISMKVIKL